MSATGWVVLGVLAVLLVWTVTVYNRLVQLRNRIANALGQIDVQLKRRYDLIPNLVEVARGYLAHEAATLEAVIKARSQAQGAAAAVRAAPQSASAMGALAAAEGVLGGSLGRLMVVAESYPELKADATMQSLSEEITSTENRLGFARQAYNDQVMSYNSYKQSFPTALLAGRFGHSEDAALLEFANSQAIQAAPKVSF